MNKIIVTFENLTDEEAEILMKMLKNVEFVLQSVRYYPAPITEDAKKLAVVVKERL